MAHYELLILGGDWGLVSLQPASVAAAAYVRMAARSSGSSTGGVRLAVCRAPLSLVNAPYPTLACGTLMMGSGRCTQPVVSVETQPVVQATERGASGSSWLSQWSFPEPLDAVVLVIRQWY